MLKTVINSVFMCRCFIVDGGAAVILHLGKYGIGKHVTHFLFITGMLRTMFRSTDHIYSGADKSLARPTSCCISFDGENISFDASLVLYIYK